MKTYEVQETDPKYEGLVLVEREQPKPSSTEVLIRMQACSLNYRDLAIASGEMEYPGANLPVIPLSDGAGKVVEVGDDVDRFTEGDRVATPFAPDWIHGKGTPKELEATTGGTIDGALTQYATFPANSVSRIPEHFSYKEGATLTCAGLTAWRTLAEDGNLEAGETVLVLGTGGVSTFALQFATMHGARTIVTSSSNEKLNRARELGAWETINYVDTPEWDEPVQDITGGGVDHIVEVGGPGTLERSIRAVSQDGHIHLIGILTGKHGQIDPSPVQQKAVKLEGVTGVGSRVMFERMTRAIEATGMKPIIDRSFSFENARDAYHYLENGAHQGKVIVTVD